MSEGCSSRSGRRLTPQRHCNDDSAPIRRVRGHRDSLGRSDGRDDGELLNDLDDGVNERVEDTRKCSGEDVHLRAGESPVLRVQVHQRGVTGDDLRTHSGVKLAIVLSRRDGRGEPQLSDGRLSEGDSKEALDSKEGASVPSSLSRRDLGSGPSVGRRCSVDHREKGEGDPDGGQHAGRGVVQTGARGASGVSRR